MTQDNNGKVTALIMAGKRSGVLDPLAERAEHPAQALQRLRFQHRLSRGLVPGELVHAGEPLRDAHERVDEPFEEVRRV